MTSFYLRLAEIARAASVRDKHTDEDDWCNADQAIAWLCYDIEHDLHVRFGTTWGTPMREYSPKHRRLISSMLALSK